MSLYTLIIVTFIIFMAINVIIGLRGRKHASTTKEFLTASGQSGIWFVIASAVGASIGSGVVIGTTQYAVKLGVAGAWYAIACGLACIVFALKGTKSTDSVTQYGPGFCRYNGYPRCLCQ